MGPCLVSGWQWWQNGLTRIPNYGTTGLLWMQNYAGKYTQKALTLSMNRSTILWYHGFTRTSN